MQLIHSCCECFCWALPLFLLLCLVCFLTKRKSGWGICGSSGVVPLCLLCVCFGCGLLPRIWPQCHVHILFAYSLLFSLGPSLERHRPSRNKKKYVPNGAVRHSCGKMDVPRFAHQPKVWWVDTEATAIKELSVRYGFRLSSSSSPFPDFRGASMQLQLHNLKANPNH